jgi:hypothetical protein
MSDIAPNSLLALADDLARQAGRYHPGRPPFSALSRASDALRQAAQEVANHERHHGSRMPAE